MLPLILLLGSSMLALASISRELMLQQLLWIGVGAAAIVIFSFVEWRPLFNSPWFIWGLYAVSLLLLAFTYFTAPVIRNTRSWLAVGPFRFQPVELMKISFIILYAYYFSRHHIGIGRWRTILASLLYFLPPAAIVMLMPDLGSGLVLFGIWFGFLLMSGLPWKKVAIAICVFVAAGALMWQFGLQAYHKERIAGVFFPERDVLGINYSVSQAKIAIGSAGFWGKGFGQGTQTQLGFLTEAGTDFIFAAIVEEWGWIAGVALIAAFVWLVMLILRVGFIAERNFEKFMCLGSALALGWQFFLNIGSTIGIFPVVGVTLPFVSYGGSSILMSFFLLSIINAIAARS